MQLPDAVYIIFETGSLAEIYVKLWKLKRLTIEERLNYEQRRLSETDTVITNFAYNWMSKQKKHS